MSNVPPLADLSGPEYDAILQGVDFLLYLDFAEDEDLADTDIFIQTFREGLNGKKIADVSTASIDMQNRRVALLVDGAQTTAWFKSRTDVTEQSREFPIFSTLRHTDADGNDRDMSGIDIKYRFRINYSRA